MKISYVGCLRKAASLIAVLFLTSFTGGAISLPTAGAEEGQSQPQVTSADSQTSPDWKAKFKEQIAREDAEEGRAGHEDQVNAAMQKLMDEIAKGTNDHAAHTGGPGPYSDMSMMQQMDHSYILGPAAAG